MKKNKWSEQIFQKWRFKEDKKNPKIDSIVPTIDKEMSLPEFFKMFSALSLSNPEIQALYRFVDVNKNNRIDIDEWQNFYELFIEVIIQYSIQGIHEM